MALSIKHPKADELARTLARETGESLTEAVLRALEERLVRERGKRRPGRLAERLIEIGRHCAALPELDRRSPDEIIGYDEQGLLR